MAGGPFGVSGPSLDPLQLLKARVVAPDGTPQAAPQAPAPSPVPMAAAPSPAPAGTGPSDGGGGSGAFSGIGSALSRAISGDGLFGGHGPDGPADPVTGLTDGDKRRNNMQGMMKFGMMLMAAGMRQSDDSRARILSALPGTLGDNDINGFARNRLEMAKIRLLEKQQAAELAQGAALSKVFGAQGAPVETVPNGTPTAVPNGTNPAPLAAPLPGAPVEGAPAPVSGDPGMVPAPAPAPAPAPGAGVVPAQPSASIMPLLGEAPKPKRPVWQPAMQERAAFDLLPPKAKIEYVTKRTAEMANEKYESVPYIPKGSNLQVVDVYQGDQKVGIRTIGPAPEHMTVVNGPDQTQVQEKRDSAGRLVDRKVVRDTLYDEAEKGLLGTVEKDSSELRKLHRESVAPAAKNFDKLVQLEDTVRSGETLTGKMADVQRNAIGWLDTMGMLQNGDVQKLVATNRVSAELGAAAGRFAKENYGPQVSNQDVVNAQQLLGAISTGNKDEIADALARIRQEQRNKIENFNGAADEFNSRLEKTRANKDFYRAPRVDKDFGQEMPWEKREREKAAAQPAPEASSAPAGPRQTINGVTYEFDGKGWKKVN